MWRPNIANRAFDRMGEKYARIIDPYHFLGRSAFDIPRKKMLLPAVNIVKEDEALFVMEVAIPGFNKEEIEIMVKDEVLTIRGERSKRSDDKTSEYILEEFNFDTFERSFRLSPTIAREKISAKYENGLLRLTFVDVPESEEKTHQKVKVS